MAKKKVIFGISMLVMLFACCFPHSLALAYYFPGDDASWTEKSLSDLNLDNATIEAMYDYIKNYSHYIQSVLISRDGYIIHDQYLENYDRISAREFGSWSPSIMVGPQYTQVIDGKHAMWSVTKSITSLLVGIAIANGNLTGVDQKFFDIFPDKMPLNTPNETIKLDITLEDILTMQTGLNWSEASDGFSLWPATGYNLTYILNKTLIHDPGTTFEYSTGNTELLAAVLQNVTGMLLSDYAKEVLFDPIGVNPADVFWFNSPWEWNTITVSNISHGGFGIYTKPRIMARIGELCLNNGSWNGVQIIPAQWITNSTQEHATPIGLGEDSMYGYLWWLRPAYKSNLTVDYYSAVGAFGQQITVIPALNMVVAITADTILEPSPENAAPHCINYIIDHYIIPAVKETTQGIPGYPLFLILGMISLSAILIVKKKKTQL